MSKPIRMTPEIMEECRKDFEKALAMARLSDGKLNFTKTFTGDARKAVVCFTPEAWAKMVMLIRGFDKEVAWHGVANRKEGEELATYVISDIVVYPQTVTGASVDMDEEKYGQWLMENDEDPRFANLRMQGHSHVNMATSPSGTDLKHQEDILQMVRDDSFYIFMIWNKSFNSTTKIYDLRENILFDDADITIRIAGAAEDLDVFLEKAKEMVVSKTYQPVRASYTYPSSNASPYNPLTQKQTAPKEKKRSEFDGNGQTSFENGQYGGWYGMYRGY